MAGWVRLYRALSDSEVPLVAAMNGVAVGAGLQLGLLCDLRVVGRTSRFGLREVDVGLPAISGLWLLASMLGRSRAIELIMTGRLVGASEAFSMGLVHEVVEPSEVLPQALAMANALASVQPAALRATKRRLRETFADGLRDASDAATRYQVEAVATGIPQQFMERFLAGRPTQAAGS